MFKVCAVVIILDLLYEFIEMIFPSKKMKSIIKSFSLTLILYLICDYLFKLL